MINIILMFALIASLLRLFGMKAETLNCGIWGYYGPKDRPGFDWVKFDWIGAENDSRGGDACGRVTGTRCEHSNAVRTDTYKKYIKMHLPMQLDDTDKVVIGHTRKMSPIYRDKSALEYTQPLLYFNEDNSIKAVAVHNGTILEYKKLLEEFGDDKDVKHLYFDANGEPKYVDMNDSQVLMYLIAKQNNWNVLAEYRGAAAFAYYDYAEDFLYLWSGSSKMTEHSVLNTRERPLFYLASKDHVWFSSEEEPLDFINYSADDIVKAVPENTLLKFQDGVLVDSIFYDRSDTGGNFTKPIAKKDFVFNRSEWVEDDDWSYYPDYQDRRERQFEKSRNEYEKGSYSFVQCKACEGTGTTSYATVCVPCDGNGLIKQYNPATLKVVKNEDEEKPKNVMLGEELPTEHMPIIRYARGNYYFGQNLAHGIYHLNKYGKSYHPQDKEQQQYTEPFYFILGNLMTGHTAYNKWSKKVNKTDVMSLRLAKHLSADCENPVYVPKSGILISNITNRVYSGIYYPRFTYWKYSFVKGIFAARIMSTDSGNYPDVKKREEPLVSAENPIGPSVPAVIVHPAQHEIPWNEDFDPKMNKRINLINAYSDIKITDKGEKAENDAYDEMVIKELSNDLANVMLAVNDAENNLFTYSSHKTTKRFQGTYDLIKKALSDLIQ